MNTEHRISYRFILQRTPKISVISVLWLASVG